MVTMGSTKNMLCISNTLHEQSVFNIHIYIFCSKSCSQIIACHDFPVEAHKVSSLALPAI